MSKPSDHSFELQNFYTPTKIIKSCVGITPYVNHSRFPNTLFFRFHFIDPECGISLHTEKEDELGLLEIRDKLASLGYNVPKEMGTYEPLSIKRVSISSKSVCIKLPETLVTRSDRIYFKYNKTFGSFNSAMYNALQALTIYENLVSTLNLQSSIIKQTHALASVDSKTLLEYSQRLSTPNFEAPYIKRKCK